MRPDLRARSRGTRCLAPVTVPRWESIREATRRREERALIDEAAHPATGILGGTLVTTTRWPSRYAIRCPPQSSDRVFQQIKLASVGALLRMLDLYIPKMYDKLYLFGCTGASKEFFSRTWVTSRIVAGRGVAVCDRSLFRLAGSNSAVRAAQAGEVINQCC